MREYSKVLFLLLFLAVPASSQEEDTDAAADDAVDAVEATEATETIDVPELLEVAEEQEIDDSDLDIQTYEEDEDDFVPTEEIPADEPIPLPSNI